VLLKLGFEANEAWAHWWFRSAQHGQGCETGAVPFVGPGCPWACSVRSFHYRKWHQSQPEIQQSEHANSNVLLRQYRKNLFNGIQYTQQYIQATRKISNSIPKSLPKFGALLFSLYLPYPVKALIFGQGKFGSSAKRTGQRRDWTEAGRV